MDNYKTSPFDSLAAKYDAWFEGDGKLIFDTEVRAMREILPMLPRPWLEIGVGSGRFARALGIENGLDPSFKLLEIARKRGINTFLAAGEDEIFTKDTFGTVFLIFTLCFLSSPLSVLREAYRILIPNGNLILGLILKESPWGKLYQLKKQRGHQFYRHATFYSYGEVEIMLHQTGFVVINTISTLFQKPDDVKKVENPQEKLAGDAGFVVVVAEKTKAVNRRSI